ncbi:MAG: D-2-hydroxyacid dehydrogenase [Chloroflexi bacterium]|nr:D-2-hydroxyacid dehydrogenase [Chloroflexota bacterium]
MTERLTVVASPHFVVRPEQLARLHDAHPRVDLQIVTTPDELAAALPNADGAVIRFPLSAEMLASAPHLRWLHVMSAGVERMLTPALATSSLTISASKGPMSTLMAEHAVTLMLALARQLPDFFRDQQARRWRRYPAEHGPLTEVIGKTMLVVGAGGVGTEVARICKLGFQMRVLGVSRTRRDCPFVDEYVEPDRLRAGLAEADVVSLSLPVTPATHHLIDAAALAAMKPTAYLINVARGSLVDEAALVEALTAGRIAGAGLDALAVEPLPDDSPLWSLPNTIVTPHTSAITDRLGDRFVEFWCENIRRFAEGEPVLGLVNKEAGY